MAHRCLRAIAVVEASVERGGSASVERRCSLSSLPLDAKLFARTVRCHWHAENRLHWVLDIVFREDLSRLRSAHGPQNKATIRHMAMTLLRGPNDKHSLKARRKSAAWNTTRLEALLRQSTWAGFKRLSRRQGRQTIAHGPRSNPRPPCAPGSARPVELLFGAANNLRSARPLRVGARDGGALQPIEDIEMQSKFMIATGLTCALAVTGALPALAQSSTQSDSSSSATMSQGSKGQGGMSLRQHIVQDLEKDGYKNVQVMPASMIAQATDKQGRPVTMLITPDSVTTVVAMGTAGSASDGGSGSNSSGDKTPPSSK